MKKLVTYLAMLIPVVTYANEYKKSFNDITPEQKAIIQAYSMNMMQQSIAKHCSANPTANEFFQEGLNAFKKNNPTFFHYMKRSNELIKNRSSLQDQDKKFVDELVALKDEFQEIEKILIDGLKKVPTTPYCQGAGEKMKQISYSTIVEQADKKYEEYTEKAKTANTNHKLENQH